MFLDVNFLAVIVAAVLNFFIGMLWYSEYLFKKIWQSDHTCKTDSCCKCCWSCYAYGLGISFATAWVFAALIDWLGLDTVGEGLYFGFLVWLGFIATSYLWCVLKDHKKFSVYLVNIGYQLVSLLFFGAILTAWQN